MKSILIIFILTLSTLLAQEPPILDRLVITDTSTIWTQQDGYQSSNFQVSGIEYFKEIDTTYFIKIHNTGYLLSANDGSGYKIIDLPNINQYKPVTWDIPYDNINLIYGYELVNGNGIIFKITSRVGNTIDSIYNIYLDSPFNQTIYNDGKSNIRMLALDNQNILIYADYMETYQPFRYRKSKTYYYDFNANMNWEIPGLKLHNASISNSLYNLINFSENIHYEGDNRNDGADTYDVIDLSSKNSPKLIKSYGVGSVKNNSISYFLINDSLSIFTTNDSLIVYNFLTSTKLKTYDVSSRNKFRDYYYHEQSKSVILNSFTKSNDEKFVTAIHLPSLNIIKDTINDKPYLGKILTQMENGKHLSFGEGGFIYKFDFNLGLNYSESDFTFNILTSNEYQFNDQSKGPIVKWNWDFGDGTTSELRNPQHKFSKNGIYNIKLIVENEFGLKDTLVKSLESIDKLNSFFTADLLKGKVPHKVEFKNRSSNNTVRFIWNFGDGTSSIEPNPTHIFNTPGIYGISLTVFDSQGKFDIRYIEDLIIVED